MAKEGEEGQDRDRPGGGPRRRGEWVPEGQEQSESTGGCQTSRGGHTGPGREAVFMKQHW